MIHPNLVAMFDALRLVNEARTPAHEVKAGATVLLHSGIPHERRCENDVGYQVHEVAESFHDPACKGSPARYMDQSGTSGHRDCWHIVTDQTSYRCSPRNVSALVVDTAS